MSTQSEITEILTVRNANMQAYPEIHFVDEKGNLLYVYFLSKPTKFVPGVLIPCPHCTSQFLQVEVLLSHLEREHQDKKHD